jgi:hypothetical protein
MPITLICANASQWSGPIPDLVFTNPYAPFPACVRGVPAIISLFEGKGDRKALGEEWLGVPLTKLGRWGDGLKNSIYITPNMSRRNVKISDLVCEPGHGWMPLELPLRLLDAYTHKLRDGAVIWDGFCGRGTIGKAALMLGYSYIGIDNNPARIEIARAYLGC